MTLFLHYGCLDTGRACKNENAVWQIQRSAVVLSPRTLPHLVSPTRRPSRKAWHASLYHVRDQSQWTGIPTKATDEYIVYLQNEAFTPEDIMVDKKPVPEWFIREAFERYHRLPILKRFNNVVQDIVDNVMRYYGHELKGKERTDLHATIRKMFPSTNLRMLYKNFYKWLGRPELLKLRKGSVHEYSDVYPLLYFKIKLEGLKANHKVKHLVIDEMQDYSAVQYKVLNMLYSCNKTILGDINQSVNPFSSSDLETITSVFPDATTVKMLKSYRSTYEITEFSKKISDKAEVEAIERHGDAPEVVAGKNQDEEIQIIERWLSSFEKSDFNPSELSVKHRNRPIHYIKN